MARSTSKPFSDIDLALLVGVNIPRPLVFELNLEVALPKITKIPVDVRILNCAPISFIQNVIRNGYRVPDDYADTFKVMAEAGVLNQNFSNDLKAMARFRNRFVHSYWEVDNEQLFEIIKTRLGAVSNFLGWGLNH